MSPTRRDVLRAAGLVSTAAALPFSLGFRRASGGLLLAGDPPETEFEQTGGASWTSHEQELVFLAAIAGDRPDRVALRTLTTLPSGRPLHLAVIGAPVVTGESPKGVPTVLFVCSQHGDEPAGREAGLQLIRDLAYSDDPAVERQLREQAILVIPSANPDGRAANSRRNADDVDINRDHLGLATQEAQAIATVVGDWAPSLILDLHEYGPSVPVLYDDDVLYLWPRNLNVDRAIQDNARSFCLEYVKKDSEAAGYSADEYGLFKVGPNVGPLTVPVDAEVTQTAGGPDEGICRNAMGLRHAMGILIESAVTANPKHGPQAASTAGVRTRRVESQVVVTRSTLRYMREQGEAAKAITDGSPVRKAREGELRSAPLYFNGADNAESTSFADPPPSGYRLDGSQLAEASTALGLHGVAATPVAEGGAFVTMAQHAEPVIGLLLDGRGSRSIVAATPLDD